MSEQEISSMMSLNLSLSEINIILDALGQRPFAEVYELVAKIQQQAQVQMRSDPAESE